MTVTYYKRFRMEIELGGLAPPPEAPRGLFWVPWHEAMLEHHAHVKFRCFEKELDAKIFPCLGDRIGCRQLMDEIRNRRGFLPEATWLIGNTQAYVGTVQGVVDRYRVGMIQNLGVIPEMRGRGIGRLLLLKALDGFRQAGLHRGMLEVTADNTVAVRLYRRLGFRRCRTVYKAVDSV